MASSELSNESLVDFSHAIERLKDIAIDRQKTIDSLSTITDYSPDEASASHPLQILPRDVPDQGWGLQKSIGFLLDEVAPLLNPGQAGPRYFGFITGGTLPSALLSDWFTTLYDQNVQVHLPKETSSTLIDVLTMKLIIKLLNLDVNLFTGTLTTGATTSNVLALTCARESTIKECMKRREGISNWSTAEYGLSNRSPPVSVFVCQSHASIKKAAALVGIGRANVIDIGKQSSGSKGEQHSDSLPETLIESLEFDIPRLEAALKNCYDEKEAAIVVVGMGEVVTGALTDQTLEIRKLCNEYGAWLHMDAAFSAYVCLLEGYKWITSHMSVCDSITSDAHKALNVPYDCGILIIKKDSPSATSHSCLLDEVCGPGRSGGPSYLATTSSSSSKSNDPHIALQEYTNAMPSPLNRNLENSRRFRALPVYISLLSQGRKGITEMIQRNVDFCNRLRLWFQSCPYYQLLTPICPPLDLETLDTPQKWKGNWATTVIFFRPHPVNCPVEAYKDASTGHLTLIQAIKETRKVYVSPGSMNGVGGARIAVSNWATGLNGDNDFDITTAVLLQVMKN